MGDIITGGAVIDEGSVVFSLESFVISVKGGGGVVGSEERGEDEGEVRKN